MKISKIVTCTSLALCFTLGIADSLLPTRIVAADTQTELSRARSLVEDAQDAIARVRFLTPEEIDADPELVREAQRLAEDARAALAKARASLDAEFGKTIHKEEAIQINLALESSEKKLRDAVKNLPSLPVPEAKEGRMSAERAIEVLNHDVEILTKLLEQANALYDDDHARATLQAAFDKIGTAFPHVDSWGDGLWLKTNDPLRRLSRSIVIIRRQADWLVRNGARMNAEYVAHLHSQALQLGRDHKRFMEIAAGIVDNLARQAKSMHDDNNDGEVGNPNPELEQLKREVKPLYDAIRDPNLLKRPMEGDEWAKRDAK